MTDASRLAAFLLAAALDYHALGWTVIPCRGKVAACRWKAEQHRRQTEDHVRQMFRLAGITGVAVLCGRVSGGLCVLDFDSEAAYQQWVRRFPDLAAHSPTVRTRRGYHVYLRFDRETFMTFEGGELRADSKHYVLAPPSAHPDGGTYSWVLPFTGTTLSLLPESYLTPSLSPQTPNKYLYAKSGLYEQTKYEILEEVIGQTQPTGPGMRHWCIFELCRHLKALPQYASAHVEVLEGVVRQWWELARPNIRTRKWEATWQDFVDAWRRVRCPAGMAAADLRAWVFDLVPRPPGPNHVPDNLYRAGLVCEVLQEGSGGHPFQLAGTFLGDCLDVSRQTADGLIHRMVGDGLLLRRSWPSRKHRKPGRYLYTGPGLHHLLQQTPEQEEETKTA